MSESPKPKSQAKTGGTFIGVDLGGTNMRAGRVSKGIINAVSATQVPRTDHADVVMQTLIKTIHEVIEPGVKAIGIGVPGLVDREKGMVYRLQNIPSWKNIALKSQLEDVFDLPVLVNNDANCFAVGERFYGQGVDSEDFVGLISGTGLGAGIIKNGFLISGRNCGAGEFGLLPYLDGTLEDYASGKFFDTHYHKKASEMAALASQGDKKAIQAFRQFGQHLGQAMKTILATLDPELIILGGGLSRAYSIYRESLEEELSGFAFPESLERFRVLPSALPEIAILGAAALCLNARIEQ